MNPKPAYSREECPSCHYDFSQLPDSDCIIPGRHPANLHNPGKQE